MTTIFLVDAVDHADVRHVIAKCSTSSLERERDIMDEVASPYGIPAVLDYQEVGGWHILVMEYVGVSSGTVLGSLCQDSKEDSKTLTVIAAILVSPRCCSVTAPSNHTLPYQIYDMEIYHWRRIIHSDIRPLNSICMTPSYKDWYIRYMGRDLDTLLDGFIGPVSKYTPICNLQVRL